MLLAPVPADRRPRRVGQLLVGLTAYGVSAGMLVRAGLGVDPWDVLHQGLARSVGGGMGTWTDVVGLLVLLAWIPLRQRPGLGTVANVVVIGLVLNVVLAVTPVPGSYAVRVPLLLLGVLSNGVAGGLYIGAGLGPGPRDGLTTGIAARGLPIWAVRTVVEVVVLATGFALGGTVGAGTVLYAVAIGPVVHRTIPWLTLRPAHPRHPRHLAAAVRPSRPAAESR